MSNWFINARVRLWKPMVEEMYMEEIKEQDKANGTPEDKADQEKSQHHHNNNNISTSPTTATAIIPGGFNLSEIDSITQGASPKKQRIADADTKPPPDVDSDAMTIKFGDRQGRDGAGFTLMGAPANFIGGFGSYPMGELGRFGAEQFQTTPNGVSLTLGLPHCDNISMSAAHQSFLQPNQSMQLGRGVEMGEANDFGGMNAAAGPNANVYDNINIQNRKRFAAQLLPDFVA